MVHLRHGTSLPEAILALTLIATVAAWSLRTVTAAQRTAGGVTLRREALHRADRALADLASLGCAGATVSDVRVEPRWQLALVHARTGDVATDRVVLQTTRGDSLVVQHSTWCGA